MTRAIRLILIVLVGGLSIYLTYKSRYHTFFFEDLVWIILMIFGLILLTGSFTQDLKTYRSSKRILGFFSTLAAVLFIIVISVMQYNIRSDFNKPSLLRVFYNGDYNGTAIDFKTDGTFIFDDSSIGISDYQYGSYRIMGNRIVIDKKGLDNVALSSILEIRDKEIELAAGKRMDKYLYQVSDEGQVIANATEFRVVVDNRNN
jgi:uncharacterized membrane protein YphA (DoxX/SURF4 family)